MIDSPIIVALDCAEPKMARQLIDRLKTQGCRFKIGKELFTRAGPAFVEELTKDGLEIFLDLKFHDIPNTVARACQAAADLGVWMLNVHASGGPAMLESARESLSAYSSPPKLIAVTLLTSLSQADLIALGWQGTPEQVVLRLAKLAKKCGLDGVVCSPREAALLRSALGQDFLLVTPGIRTENSAADDQQRSLSPAAAKQAGANYLVIGRPITAAADPAAALRIIHDSLN